MYYIFMNFTDLLCIWYLLICIELDSVISAIRSEKIDDNNCLEVERCGVTTEITVKNITNHYNKKFIGMYFASKRSGGGECTCEMTGENEAAVKFSDSTGKLHVNILSNNTCVHILG